MKYKVVKPIYEKGMLYEAGSEIELTEERAKALGYLVEPIQKVVKNIKDKEIKSKRTHRK